MSMLPIPRRRNRVFRFLRKFIPRVIIPAGIIVGIGVAVFGSPDPTPTTSIPTIEQVRERVVIPSTWKLIDPNSGDRTADEQTCLSINWTPKHELTDTYQVIGKLSVSKFIDELKQTEPNRLYPTISSYGDSNKANCTYLGIFHDRLNYYTVYVLYMEGLDPQADTGKVIVKVITNKTA